jgi:hypothetical protein
MNANGSKKSQTGKSKPSHDARSGRYDNKPQRWGTGSSARATEEGRRLNLRYTAQLGIFGTDRRALKDVFIDKNIYCITSHGIAREHCHTGTSGRMLGPSHGDERCGGRVVHSHSRSMFIGTKQCRRFVAELGLRDGLRNAGEVRYRLADIRTNEDDAITTNDDQMRPQHVTTTTTTHRMNLPSQLMLRIRCPVQRRHGEPVRRSHMLTSSIVDPIECRLLVLLRDKMNTNLHILPCSSDLKMFRSLSVTPIGR